MCFFTLKVFSQEVIRIACLPAGHYHHNCWSEKNCVYLITSPSFGVFQQLLRESCELVVPRLTGHFPCLHHLFEHPLDIPLPRGANIIIVLSDQHRNSGRFKTVCAADLQKQQAISTSPPDHQSEAFTSRRQLRKLLGSSTTSSAMF